jgi:hypothetical protein
VGTGCWWLMQRSWVVCLSRWVLQHVVGLDMMYAKCHTLLASRHSWAEASARACVRCTQPSHKGGACSQCHTHGNHQLLS